MRTIEGLHQRIKGNAYKPTHKRVTIRPWNIIKKNQEVILAFDKELAGNGAGYSTRVHYLIALARLSHNSKKTFKQMKKEDIADFFSDLRDNGINQGRKTKGENIGDRETEHRNQPQLIETMRICIKRFYKWLEGDDEEYPRKVRWLKPDNGVKKRRQAKDLPTESEIKKMLQACGSSNTLEGARNQAIIALLADTPLRRGEVVGCRIKDLDLDSRELRIPDEPVESAKAKTGAYTVYLKYSLDYLKRWLDIHPRGQDKSAPLFIAISRRRFGQPLEGDGLYLMLRRIAKRANLDKLICPVLFRHRWQTIKAYEKWNNVEINVACGRSPYSREAATYIHPEGHLKAKALGELVEQKKMEDPLKPWVCWRCQTSNIPTHNWCGKCSAPRNPEDKQVLLHKEQIIDKELVPVLVRVLVKNADKLDLGDEDMNAIKTAYRKVGNSGT